MVGDWIGIDFYASDWEWYPGQNPGSHSNLFEGAYATIILDASKWFPNGSHPVFATFMAWHIYCII